MANSKKDYAALGKPLMKVARGRQPTPETIAIRGLVGSMATSANYTNKRDAVIAEIKRIFPDVENAGSKADNQAKALDFNLPVRRQRKVSTVSASPSGGNDLAGFIEQVESLQHSLSSIRDRASLMAAFKKQNRDAIKALKGLSFEMPDEEYDEMVEGL